MTATSSPDDHLGPPEERRTDERDQRPEMLAAGYDAPPWRPAATLQRRRLRTDRHDHARAIPEPEGS
jgi:hypothetical protein